MSHLTTSLVRLTLSLSNSFSSFSSNWHIIYLSRSCTLEHYTQQLCQTSLHHPFVTRTDSAHFHALSSCQFHSKLNPLWPIISTRICCTYFFQFYGLLTWLTFLISLSFLLLSFIITWFSNININIYSIELKWDGKITKYDNEMRWIQTMVWNAGDL